MVSFMLCMNEAFLTLLMSLVSVSQLSGTDILDAIDNEATGTLKDCYITLGSYKKCFY